MDNYTKRITDNLRKINVSESTASLILGVLVVLVLAVLAYNFFKVKPTVQTTPNSAVVQEQNKDTTKPTSPSGELTAPTAAVSLPATHTVQRGETLWTIAEKYYSSGFNWNDIAKANGLAKPYQLTVGQKLTIPNTRVLQPSVAQKVTPVVTMSKIEGNTYTVARGDNLWNIALRAYGDGFKWTQIAQANRLANPRLIHAGNVFSIPR